MPLAGIWGAGNISESALSDAGKKWVVVKVLMRRQSSRNSKVLLIEMLNGIATLEYHCQWIGGWVGRVWMQRGRAREFSGILELFCIFSLVQTDTYWYVCKNTCGSMYVNTVQM